MYSEKCLCPFFAMLWMSKFVSSNHLSYCKGKKATINNWNAFYDYKFYAYISVLLFFFWIRGEHILCSINLKAMVVVSVQEECVMVATCYYLWLLTIFCLSDSARLATRVQQPNFAAGSSQSESDDDDDGRT